MAERPPHKRSKSARVLNLIRGEPRTAGTGSEEASPIDSSPSETFPSLVPSTTASTNRLVPIDTTTSATQSYPTSSPQTGRSSATTDKISPSGGQHSSMSIEDSIRTFRVFEVLRSGNTGAITKAIEDSTPSFDTAQSLAGTTVLHLATQCAEPEIVDFVISSDSATDVNAQDREGNAALHLAAQLGRTPVVKRLLEQPGINDAILNYKAQAPIDLARTPEIFQQLQLARALFVDQAVREIHTLAAQNDYKKLEEVLTDSRVESCVDVNALELAIDPATVQSGGTLLHEAARRRDMQLAQILLLHGADPFRRDRKGKLPQDVTKDDRTRAILKKSPAAAAAQRGIQEKAILGNTSAQAASATAGGPEGSKDSREMKGYLKKWTNYTSGYKLRWFVLEDGVLSYYKHQDDAGSACRGAINMRIARMHMDAQDKTRFEIHGKSSVKYHLKANHQVEAKRWFWSLNNAIQYTKDEAQEHEKRRTRDAENLRQAKVEASDRFRDSSDDVSMISARPKGTLGGPASLEAPQKSTGRGADNTLGEEAGSAYDSYETSMIGNDLNQTITSGATATVDMDDEAYEDDESVHESSPSSKDAFNITMQSAKVQLDLLSRVCGALDMERGKHPDMPISDKNVSQALAAYTSAVSSLDSMMNNLLKISSDRDASWQYKLDREADARKMWEESMARIAQEHEDMQKSIDQSEEKRKRTKRALKEALEGQSAPSSRPDSKGLSEGRVAFAEALEKVPLNREGGASSFGQRRKSVGVREGARRKSVIAQFTNLSDSESGDDDEFYDAVDAGEVEIVTRPLPTPALPLALSSSAPTESKDLDEGSRKQKQIEPSYSGYEAGIRKRLKMDADNRPKISLWGILKSMIGQDMTKMTLPVSFNEPTSLLQRVAEDMEYADLLDVAADRTDATERLVYVAAFAASEYASTIGRVAKPFNPLLGETYEYVRPDKGYRFYIEQVSHHPPIGAAYAESARWDYYGESSVRSKFYGKSFDINPLGTWFLRLRPACGGPIELYTWKKVTSSVVGIITGSPTVDNYGAMEIKNWTTGEVCTLDFKPRGWKASSAFQVTGKVMGKDGVTKWSIGGRWNDKIYARSTPGFEDEKIAEGKTGHSGNQAFLVWEAHTRPTGIPFNLTPFVVTLNDPNPQLTPRLPPTDTRLRPDQRAMEDGEYDFAATEKNRLEEKQRAARRVREAKGEEFKPKWFVKQVDKVTREMYWESTGAYWDTRAKGDWSVCDDIF